MQCKHCGEEIPLRALIYGYIVITGVFAVFKLTLAWLMGWDINFSLL